MITGAEHIGQFWAELTIEELVRNGVRRFCVSPGSRSSPLAVAVARHSRTESTVHFDERGAAFFAVGWARAEGAPAAVITTSGTAVANCLPAVIEASMDELPMILLTADRPPELRQTGANQSIPQVGVFGEYVRWFFDMPVAAEDVDPTFVLTTVDQAVHRSLEGRGPVHLNCMFREPLAPTPVPGFEPPVNVSLGRWLDSTAPFTQYDAATRRPSDATIERVVSTVQSARNGVIVSGRLRSEHDGEMAVRLARALSWPLLPEPLSNVAHMPGATVVPHLDLYLKTGGFRSWFRPDCVLHLGSGTISRAMDAHLADHAAADLVVVAPGRDRLDPVHRVTHRVEADVASFCERLIDRLDIEGGPGSPRPSAMTTPLSRLSARGEEALDTLILGGDREVTEPSVARSITRLLPAGHDLFASASMPIRDLDMFGRPLSGGRYAANRGASGIDGTVASAVGFATARERPVTLVIGDLALLHDLNSLDLVSKSGRAVTVIAVNNDGGGVFSFLPISKQDGIFETYFGVPHGRDFEKAAGMFALDYYCPDMQGEFERDLMAAWASDRSCLIEVKTSRIRNKELHLQIYGAVEELTSHPEAARSGS